MRVIIDTNVLVSAALRDRAPEAVILFVVERPDFEWIVSTGIVQEYKEVLSRKKFGLSQDILQRWFTLLDTVTTFVPVDIVVTFPRDQKDAKFFGMRPDEPGKLLHYRRSRFHRSAKVGYDHDFIGLPVQEADL